MDNILVIRIINFQICLHLCSLLATVLHHFHTVCLCKCFVTQQTAAINLLVTCMWYPEITSCLIFSFIMLWANVSSTILAMMWELSVVWYQLPSLILHISAAEYHYTLGCLVLVWMLYFSYIQVCWLWASGSPMRSGRFLVQLPFPSSLCLGSYLSSCKKHYDRMNYTCIQIITYRYYFNSV